MLEPRESFGDFDSIEGTTESIDLDDPLLQELAETPAFAPVVPDTIGPYRVLDAVGRGGMGMVYRAQHTETGVTVALKTVRVPNEKMLASIRREIHTLASMRHPGVVRILDEGVHEGLPWYTMELLKGTTLREAMGAVRRVGKARTEQRPLGRRYGMAWWTQSLAGPLAEANANREVAPTARCWLGGGLASQPEGPVSKSLTAMLMLVRRLCAPLAYLHGEGLVHRDLKPDNVLVQPDGRPVLVDFGLASQHSRDLSRDVLQVEGSIMGTALYMSPEQIRGGLVDGRADLYALGCILYEMVTGRPPFVADRMEELLKKHLQQPAERPSRLLAGVPEGLDELMLRLLEKNPEDRFGYAEDVASALGRLGIEDGLVSSGPKPRPYLYRARFTGRATPMEVLERSLARARAGEGGLVLVHGESGVGKTRLLLEFGQQVARQDGLVLSGDCVERGGAPLQALRAPLHSLADRCRERGRSETERLFGAGARLLARYERSIQGLLDERDPSPPESVPADQAQQQLYRVLARTFTALAQAPPLLLILDDLQWADELTIGFLDSLLRSGQLERCGWLLIAAVRTEELSPELAKLCESNGAQRLRLGRLREEALGAMVCDMLALDAPPVSFVRFLQRQSEGNPFFVAEYLRTAVSEGLLFRDEQGRWHVADTSEDLATEAVYEGLPLPGSIQQLVGRRLAGLTDAGRQVVEAAVVVGREVAFPLVAWIAGLRPAELLEASAEVLRRQVLEESSGGALRFMHDKLREVAYETLHDERRQDLHRRAAEGIETLFAERVGEWQAALGHHWEQAGETEKARIYDLAGARLARDRYAFDEAERLYRAYLRLAPRADAESLAVQSELAMGVLESRGRFEDATEECERALAISRELKDRPREGQILGELAKLYRIQGRMDEARDLFEQALETLSSVSLDPLSRSLPAQRQTEGTLLGEFGILHHLRGQFDEAESLYRRALSIFSGSRGLADATPSTRDQRGEGKTLGHLAILYHEQGRLDEAKALYEEALELRRAVGDRRGVGTILGNLANLLRVQGNLEQARDLYEQALAVKREVDDREGEGYNLGNLANLHNEQGRAGEALLHFEQALQIAREVGNRRLEGIVLGNLAGFQHDHGRPVEARALYEKALSIIQELGDRPGEGILLFQIARLERRAWAQFDAAEEHLIQAESILRAVNDSLHLVICLCQRGHVELARGRSGREWLERARNLSGTLDLRSESELHRASHRLERAQEAFERGETETLFRGNALVDVTPEMILWLRVTGQLTA